MGERIRDSLQVPGYFKASVAKPRISFFGQAGTQSIDMKAAVDEGVRYHLGEIGFRNGTVFGSEQMRALQGQPYNPNRVQQWFVDNQSDLPPDPQHFVKISQDNTSGIAIVRLWFP